MTCKNITFLINNLYLLSSQIPCLNVTFFAVEIRHRIFKEHYVHIQNKYCVSKLQRIQNYVCLDVCLLHKSSTAVAACIFSKMEFYYITVSMYSFPFLSIDFLLWENYDNHSFIRNIQMLCNNNNYNY